VLQQDGLAPVVPQGGYFVLADSAAIHERSGIPQAGAHSAASPLHDRPDVKVCKWMTEHVGVTPLPCSPFFLPESRHLADGMVRFCFAKDDATLDLAAERLLEWAAKADSDADRASKL
jgi:kynurenine--oxoglutarate transaminase/cysteine-S-conjugate beta-lyase/glutamine--phenylpyruvate transaminase